MRLKSIYFKLNYIEDLGSKKDLVLGVDGARELANSIPNASYYEFSKQGHAAFIESKQFNKMILEFLRENT